MKYLEIQNNQLHNIDEITFLVPDEFQESVRNLMITGSRMIALTAIDRADPKKIMAAFLNSFDSTIQIIGGEFANSNLEFESWANEFPQTNYFECELAEQFGFVPQNHPWLRPVRKQNYILNNKPYEFYKINGDEIHEVAVGPIHAGVIEPGHFRFQCHGELVYNLEINLGYQHRGVEKLFLQSSDSQRITLAESITGDTTIGHTFAHCSAVESLTKTQVPLRAEIIRTVSLELERIAMHLSGLGGIANDIGFALPSASYGRLRTLVINSLAALCGSRFGRGLMIYGGVRYDFNQPIVEKILQNLLIIQKDIKEINEYLFSTVGALARLEETGNVSSELAKQVGIVGLAARASGLDEDIRIHFPLSAYKFHGISTFHLSTGDVFARARLRALEIDESIRIVLDLVQNISTGEIKNNQGKFSDNSFTISITEGWRGEIVHICFTNKNQNFSQYKIKDPSFNNWYGLSLALRNTAISDFPLCNKSFDLSYAGHDL